MTLKPILLVLTLGLTAIAVALPEAKAEPKVMIKGGPMKYEKPGHWTRDADPEADALPRVIIKGGPPKYKYPPRPY